MDSIRRKALAESNCSQIIATRFSLGISVTISQCLAYCGSFIRKPKLGCRKKPLRNRPDVRGNTHRIPDMLRYR